MNSQTGRSGFVITRWSGRGFGVRHNRTLKAQGTPLEEIETVIFTGDRLRWLEVEVIEGDLESIKARLDEACQIPN
jgi:hypothetical protein